LLYDNNNVILDKAAALAAFGVEHFIIAEIGFAVSRRFPTFAFLSRDQWPVLDQSYALEYHRQTNLYVVWSPVL
jgi:hypothetical protein